MSPAREGVREGCACAPRGEDSPKGYRNPEAQSRLYAGFGPYRVQRVWGNLAVPPDPLARVERKRTARVAFTRTTG